MLLSELASSHTLMPSSHIQLHIPLDHIACIVVNSRRSWLMLLQHVGRNTSTCRSGIAASQDQFFCTRSPLPWASSMTSCCSLLPQSEKLQRQLVKAVAAGWHSALPLGPSSHSSTASSPAASPASPTCMEHQVTSPFPPRLHSCFSAHQLLCAYVSCVCCHVVCDYSTKYTCSPTDAWI